MRLPVALALVALALSPACASGGGDANAGPDVIADAPGPDVGHDAVHDATGDGLVPDTTDDTLPEADASDATDDTPLQVPFTPQPVPTPYVDTPFVQEFNHTSNEVEPGIGPLVAVVARPAGQDVCGSTDGVFQVTPRALVLHDQAGATLTLTIPSDHADLLGAAATLDTVWLVGPHVAYVLRTGGGVCASLEPVPQAEGLTLRGITGGTHQAWLATDQGVIRAATVPEAQTTWAVQGAAANVAIEDAGVLYVGGDDFVAAYDLPATGDPQLLWKLDGPSLTAKPVRALAAHVTLPQALELVVLGDGGVQGVIAKPETDQGAAFVDVPLFGANRVPYDTPRQAARASDGGFVVATAHGGMRVMERGIGPEWRVYNAERWVPSPDVRGVLTHPGQADSPIAFATAAGLSYVTAERVTLEQKLVPAFVDRIVQRHDREGAVADSHLTVKGDLSSNIPWDSDNDGGWTAYWLLAECYRWKVTGAADARANFDEALTGMLRLRTLTGTDWFLARALIRKSTCILDDCDDPDDGHWFTSPVDPDFWVKRDTSNDEITSHFYMMGPAYDLCATPDQRAAIREHVAGIAGGIIDHGYQLWDPMTNAVTTYGQFDPYYVNEHPGGFLGDGGRRSAQALGLLTTAWALTGEPRFDDARRELIEVHHYAENAIDIEGYPIMWGNGDGNELGTQGYWAMLRYETDPELLALWQTGWTAFFKRLDVQQGALWDLSNHVLGGDMGPQIERFARWLRLAPVDMIRWNIVNSDRHDLKKAPNWFKDGMLRTDDRIIPYDERRNDRWNTDQFRVDGGMGAMVEMDGADVLMPYWAARYYGVIVPVEAP
jgi:hypothetical protein